MLPFSRLTLKPWADHSPGSVVFPMAHHGPCVGLRVQAPTTGDKTIPALLLLADPPWNAAAPQQRRSGPGLVILNDRDDPFDDGSALGIDGAELELEFDPQALVSSRSASSAFGVLSIDQQGRALVEGGGRELTDRWSRAFDIKSGLGVPFSHGPQVGLCGAWSLTLGLGEGRIWRIDVHVPLRTG